MTLSPKDAALVSVPWPVRLFGDLGGELGLPSVISALDLRTFLGILPGEAGVYKVSVPWAAETVTVDPANLVELPEALHPIRAAIEALQRAGVDTAGGFDLRMHSRAPKEADPARSIAACAVWVVGLLAAHGALRERSGADVIALVQDSWEARTGTPAPAEVAACILGGTLITRQHEEPLQVERELPGIVLAFAAQRTSCDAEMKRAIVQAVDARRRMSDLMKTFRYAHTAIEEAAPHMARLSSTQAGVLYAHLRARDICKDACDLLEGEFGFEDDSLGEILDDAHRLLVDYLGFDDAVIAPLIDAAAGAGALGCKLDPVGGGFIAFSPGCDTEVVDAIRKAGGAAYPAAIADGMRAEDVR